jgi:HEAT repeat protein/outer membrane protein assembly factor BamB
VRKPNRIIAVDAESGAALFKTGGLGDKVLSIGEISDTIVVTAGRIFAAVTTSHTSLDLYLAAWDASNGRFLWIRPLAAGPMMNPWAGRRAAGSRRSGASLAAWGNTVLCRTGLGVLVACAADSGEALWAYQYPSTAAARPGPRFQRRPMPPQKTGRPLNVPIAAAGVFIASPPESKTIFACKADTGEKAWSLEMQDTHVIGASGGLVFILKDRKVTAINISTGKVSWSASLDSKPLPGRALAVSGGVYLPTPKGIRFIDAQTGAKGALFPWGEDHSAGGVLAVYGDSMLVCTRAGLTCFGAKEPSAPGPPAATGIDTLIAELASPSYARRETASASLKSRAKGPALEKLKAARRSPDPEVAWRAMRITFEAMRAEAIAQWKKIIPPELAKKIPDVFNKLTYPDFRVRQKLLADLSKINDQGVSVILKELLRDPNSLIRVDAAMELLRRGDTGGVDVVRKVLEKADANRRRAVMQRLASFGSNATEELLTAATADKDPIVRVTALRGIAAFGNESHLPLFAKMLKDKAETVRIEAVLAIVKCAKERAGTFLVNAMDDASKKVRFTAVSELAKIDTPLSLKAMAKALGDPDEEISYVAGNFLFKKNPQALMPFIKELGKALLSKVPNTRYFAVQILAECGTPEAARLAAEAIDDKREEIRDTAAEFVFKSADAAAAEPLGRKLRSARLNTPYHLLDVPCRAALPGWMAAAKKLAVKELSFREVSIRYDIVQILGRIGTPEALDALAAALEDPDERVSDEAAERIFSKCKPENMPAVLKIYASSKSKTAREHAENIITCLDKEKSVPGLVAALRSEGDGDLKRKAARLLHTITGKEFGYAEAKSGEGRVRAIHGWVNWWTLQSMSLEEIESLEAAFIDPRPTVRKEAAAKAASLGARRIIDRLAGSLADEKIDWVLDAKIAALKKLTGQNFGYNESLDEEKKHAIAKKWLEWWEKAKDKW